jgi:hypothetical protein
MLLNTFSVKVSYRQWCASCCWLLTVLWYRKLKQMSIAERLTPRTVTAVLGPNDDRLLFGFRVTEIWSDLSFRLFYRMFVALSRCASTISRQSATGGRGKGSGSGCWLVPSRITLLGSLQSSFPTEISGYLLHFERRSTIYAFIWVCRDLFIVPLIIYRAYIFNTDTCKLFFLQNETLHTLFSPLSLGFLSLL